MLGDQNSRQEIFLCRGHEECKALFEAISRSLPTTLSPGEICAPLLSPPPPNLRYDTSVPEYRAKSILHSIHVISRAVTLEEPRGLELVKRLWGMMCAHTIMLLDSFVVSGTPTTPAGRDFQERVFVAVTYLLLVPVRLVMQYSVREQTALIKSYPDFLPYIFQVVFRLAQLHHPWFGTISMRLLRLDDNSLADSQLRAAFPDIKRQYDIPNICVGLLKHELAKSDSELDGYMFPSLLSVMIICIKYDPDIREELLSRNVIIYLSETALRFTSVLRFCKSTDDVDIACQAIVLSCDFIYARTSGGFTWLVQALDGRILQSIQHLPSFFSTPRTYSEELPDIVKRYHRVVSALMPFLILRSVLNRVLREVKELKDTGFLQKAASLPPLHDLVNAVMALDREAWRIKLLMYEFDDGDEFAMCCLNRTCPRKKAPEKKRIKYKRCSRCYGATYCSRKCQAACWESHKRLCIKSNRPELGQSYLLSMLDEGFIRFLVSREILTLRDELWRKTSKTVIAEFDFRAEPDLEDLKVWTLPAYYHEKPPTTESATSAVWLCGTPSEPAFKEDGWSLKAPVPRFFFSSISQTPRL
uniref:MYND-type domain-containing protein n=1 Tax=Moniliophthora roreri TaxID=221103 RepID=A0A0W0EYE9_MONRR